MTEEKYDGDKLLYSMHKQFAENQNHHQGLFIQLLVSLLVLFGGFGYVLVHTNKDIPFCQTYIEKDSFSYLIFLSVSFVVLLVLLLLNLIVIHLGYSFRRDQYLNMKIRMYTLRKEYNYVFGHLYDPTNKKLGSFLPDFYKTFFRTITLSQIAVFSITIKTVYSEISITNFIYIVLLSIIFLIIINCARSFFFKNEKCTSFCVILFLLIPIILIWIIIGCSQSTVLFEILFAFSFISILLSFYYYKKAYSKYCKNIKIEWKNNKTKFHQKYNI